MDFLHFSVVFFIGLFAGIINTIAAGGSLFCLTALIFTGIPSAVANGINRIGLMVQTVTALINFHKGKFFDLKFSLALCLPAVLGAIFGAKLAINLPEEIFNRSLAVIMLLVIFFMFYTRGKKGEKKTRKGEGHKDKAHDDNEEGISQKRKIKDLSIRKKALLLLAFLFIGFYGGYIQGGVGFLIIGVLILLTNLSLIQINAVKVFIIGVYSAGSLAVFIRADKIDWFLAAALAFGNSIGGWLGSKFAIEKGEKFVRVVLGIVLAIMSMKLLYNSFR